MIPASYLYRDAYRRHWGEDFVGLDEKPLDHDDAGQPARARILAALASVLSHRAVVTEAGPRPDATGCPPVAA